MERRSISIVVIPGRTFQWTHWLPVRRAVSAEAAGRIDRSQERRHGLRWRAASRLVDGRTAPGENVGDNEILSKVRKRILDSDGLSADSRRTPGVNAATP